MIDKLKKISIEHPVDIILRQIRALIVSGEIKPGEKLPPERKLAEHLGVGRSHVREALQKLEFYGILKTLPQSGTVVAGLGTVALEGLISNVLQIEEKDFQSLVETRMTLEKQAAFFAAQRRTNDDITKLKNALTAFEKQVANGGSAIAEDLLFHIQIAEASKNSVLKSLMMIITPEIVHNFEVLKVCDDSAKQQIVSEHQLILKNIIDGNAKKASDSMIVHLNEVLVLSQNLTAPLLSKSHNRKR